jgi:hypothetical protein
MQLKSLAGVALTAVVLAPAGAALASDADPGAPVATAAASKRLPNVVGMNHQAAQDKLQSHGFYALRERDCTGRGRALVWDRNWKVQRQSPRAGKRVSTNRTITLCSVKYTD